MEFWILFTNVLVLSQVLSIYNFHVDLSKSDVQQRRNLSFKKVRKLNNFPYICCIFRRYWRQIKMAMATVQRSAKHSLNF